ncbi:MAG: PspA/IM30 family protein [Pseudomonadota bacterium]
MANIWRKIWRIGFGRTHEVAAAMVDANAFTILDQELRVAERLLTRGAERLVGLKAQAKAQSRELERVTRQLAEREAQALQALDKDHEDLAERLACRIAELEAERAQLDERKRGLNTTIEELTDELRKGRNRIDQLRRQADLTRLQEAQDKAIDQATDLAADLPGTGSIVAEIELSLKRIEDRQQHRADRRAAANSIRKAAFGDPLIDQLAAAGIGVEADETTANILTRLKAKQAKGRSAEKSQQPHNEETVS